MVGTGTDIGKTWVSARLLERLRDQGVTVAARKPAQSFDPSDDPATLDASVLGAATSESPETVCSTNRWYETPMAPPMAAYTLARPPFTIDELQSELSWPDSCVDVGLVETAGGVRSPLAADGDCLDYCAALAPDLILLVADAGLGTINAVRLTAEVLSTLGATIVVVLNRFEAGSYLHEQNLGWLRNRDGLRVVPVPGGEAELVAFICG